MRARKLKEAGFTERQAEAQAEALADIVDERLATKRDMKEMELRLTVRMGGMITAAVAVMAVLMKIL